MSKERWFCLMIFAVMGIAAYGAISRNDAGAAAECAFIAGIAFFGIFD